MFDPNAGIIIFDSPRFEIGPRLTRADFSCSPVFDQAALLAKNEPWCSWNLKGLKLGEDLFVATLFFYGDQIKMLELANASPEFGTTWNDYSQEKELLRKKFHDQWISRNLAGRSDYSWGTIDSVLDPRAGSSFIMITYNPTATKHLR